MNYNIRVLIYESILIYCTNQTSDWSKLLKEEVVLELKGIHVKINIVLFARTYICISIFNFRLFKNGHVLVLNTILKQWLIQVFFFI